MNRIFEKMGIINDRYATNGRANACFCYKIHNKPGVRWELVLVLGFISKYYSISSPFRSVFHISYIYSRVRCIYFAHYEIIYRMLE